MKNDNLVPLERVRQVIILLRGQKVILDSDLALLYEVETKALKRAVNRNIDRFPSDFLFKLTVEEYRVLRSQFGTLKRGEHAKYLPYAFTEQGVAMLSSVLNNPRAIRMNVAIMRTFVQVRQILASHEGLARKLEQLEKKYDSQFKIVFDAIRQMMYPRPLSKKQIGFHARECRTAYHVKRLRTSRFPRTNCPA